MPDGIAAAVAAAAAEAGALALREQGREFRRWEKEPGHPVCEIDLAVDALLARRLRAIDGEAGWLSEESVDDPARLGRARAWIVDPIDGTRDYLRGRGGWCVSVALVENGRPILAVLEAPARGETWAAVRGGGAWRNGERLAVRPCDALPGARIPADTLPRSDADLVPVPRPNSIALRIAMVAGGEADLCASLRWGREWDIAAAHLVAEEAGATVTDARGRPIRYNTPAAEAFGLIVSSPAIHAAAVECLAERAAVAARR